MSVGESEFEEQRGHEREANGMLLAHEWIASIGGSENVFREIVETFPEASRLCLWNDAVETFGHEVGETKLASSRLRRKKALALPFMPHAWRQVDVEKYHTVVASSHAFAHHLASRAARSGRRGFAYVHTPARYIWTPEVEARGRGLAARLGGAPLRAIDRRAADAGVHYAANSRYIRDRIRAAWELDAEVIYPPVNVDLIASVSKWSDVLRDGQEELLTTMPRGGYLLGASRLVTYKRLDLVIDLGSALGLPVVIAGEGPDLKRLQERASTASVPVTFAGRVSTPQLYALYQEASLYAFLSVEDFGIMPVEAMACGTPVIVNEVGGAAESAEAIGFGIPVDVTAPVDVMALQAEKAMSLRQQTFPSGVDKFSARAFRRNIATWISEAQQ